MYIKNIRIENFKCFKEINISFDPNFNIVIGQNNSGKSTIFEALRLWQIAIQQFYTARTRKQENNIGFYKNYNYKPLDINDLGFLRIQDLKDVLYEYSDDKKVFNISVCFANDKLEATIPLSFKPTTRNTLNCKIIVNDEIKEEDLKQISNSLSSVMGLAYNDTFRNRIRLAYIPPKFTLPNSEVLFSKQNSNIKECLIYGKSQLVIRNILHPWCIRNYRRQTKISDTRKIKDKLSEVIEEKEFMNKFSSYIKPYIEKVLQQKVDNNKNEKHAALKKVEQGLKEVFNQDFDFISYNDPLKNKELIIKNSLDKTEISQLGSGTINVLNILSVLEFNNQTIDKSATKCNILLLDEPDSHLHSNLQKNLFLYLRELSEDSNTQIFIITHNSSLISQFEKVLFIENQREELCPITLDDYLERHLKRMDYNQYEIIRQLNTAKNQNNSLTEQLNSLTNREKPVLYTEGETDTIILENAYRKLYPERPMPFNIINGTCANHLKSIMENNDTYSKNVGQIQLALFDFDDAYNQWNGIKDFEEQEKDPYKTLTKKHKSLDGYAMLLPVPQIEEIKKQVLMDNGEHYKHESVLAIEHMFFDVELLKDYFKEEKKPGNGTIFKFKSNNKKMEFAETTNDLNNEDFKHFKPLFEKIEEIIS